MPTSNHFQAVPGWAEPPPLPPATPAASAELPGAEFKVLPGSGRSQAPEQETMKAAHTCLTPGSILSFHSGGSELLDFVYLKASLPEPEHACQQQAEVGIRGQRGTCLPRVLSLLQPHPGWALPATSLAAKVWPSVPLGLGACLWDKSSILGSGVA